MNWRSLFFHNIGWKVFSLLIALIIWHTYNMNGGTWLGQVFKGETSTARFSGFRPRVLTRQGDIRQFRTKPEQIQIWVSGAPVEIDRLEIKDILAYVDAQDYKAGDTNTVPVYVKVAQGINVTRVEPERVQLERVDTDPATGN